VHVAARDDLGGASVVLVDPAKAVHDAVSPQWGRNIVILLIASAFLALMGTILGFLQKRPGCAFALVLLVVICILFAILASLGLE